MSNDLSANMRRARLDREHDERRRAMLIQKARDMAERHKSELAGYLKSLEPKTYIIREAEAAYRDVSGPSS